MSVYSIPGIPKRRWRLPQLRKYATMAVGGVAESMNSDFGSNKATLSPPPCQPSGTWI